MQALVSLSPCGKKKAVERKKLREESDCPTSSMYTIVRLVFSMQTSVYTTCTHVPSCMHATIIYTIIISTFGTSNINASVHTSLRIEKNKIIANATVFK